MLDRIVFGDNQFFGINHMSEDKAQEFSEKFSNLNAIMDVIDFVYASGIRGFMLNSNEMAEKICDHLREKSNLYPEMRLYPSIPYPHKYANLVAERGIFRAIMSTIVSGINVKNFFNILYKGSASLLSKDIKKGMELLIEIEMKMFRGLNLKVVFLQNILTDLLLGLRIKEIFIEYANIIIKRYNTEPGFITQNLPSLKQFLNECGLENPIICASINKIGYLMNPDKEAYEKALQNLDFRPLAMSILASGAIKPKEAVEYVCKDLRISSVVFGASKKQHILDTKHLIESI